MKLSELKPCACCGQGLLREPHVGNWYVLRWSMAMINPAAARQVAGLGMMFGGLERSLPIAEAFAPGADKAVMILGDEDPSLLLEAHICMDCAMQHPPLLMVERIQERRGREAQEVAR